MVLCAVGWGTRGRSAQLAVERNLAVLRGIAEAESLPVAPFVAFCVSERERGGGRGPRTLAKVFARALRASGGDSDVALHALHTSHEQARMTIELAARNAERWRNMD